MKERLAELRSEFEKGQQHLHMLDQQRAEVRDTLLRISGAIQVLEELLRQESQNGLSSATGQNGHKEAELTGVEPRP
jgi:phage-related minor tail protein